jgi:hypothetical protein
MSVSIKSIANYGPSGKRGTGPHKKWPEQPRRNRKKKDIVHSAAKDARKTSRNYSGKEKGGGRNTQRICYKRKKRILYLASH